MLDSSEKRKHPMSEQITEAEYPQHPTAGWIPLAYHTALLDDEVRCQFFEQSLAQVAKPDWVVLDLGGGTGILSSFAARHCKKVFAIEQDPRTANALRRMVKENQLENKITVIEQDASLFVPPEPVHGVVCEMMHVGLLKEPQVPVMNAVHNTLKKNQPGKPYTVFPTLGLSSVTLLQYDFTRHGYKARFPHYLSAVGQQKYMTNLSAPVAYWEADFQDYVNPKLQAKVAGSVLQDGTLNALCMNTTAVFFKNPKLPIKEETLLWNLYGFIYPLEREIQVKRGSEFQVEISYVAGESPDRVNLRVYAQGSTLKNLD